MPVETIKVGKCLVEIIRPELNEEERKKRETEVREALGRFAFQIERSKQNDLFKRTYSRSDCRK